LIIRPKKIVITSNYHPKVYINFFKSYLKDIWGDSVVQILEPLYRRFQIIEIQRIAQVDTTKKKKRAVLTPSIQVSNKRPRLIIPPPPPYKIVGGQVVPNKSPKIQRIISDLWTSNSSEEDAVVEVSSEEEESGQYPHMTYSSTDDFEQDSHRSGSISFAEADDEIL